MSDMTGDVWSLTEQIFHLLLICRNGLDIAQNGDESRCFSHNKSLAQVREGVRRVRRLACLHARDDSCRTAFDVDPVAVVRESFVKRFGVKDIGVTVVGIDSAVGGKDFALGICLQGRRTGGKQNDMDMVDIRQTGIVLEHIVPSQMVE